MRKTRERVICLVVTRLLIAIFVKYQVIIPDATWVLHALKYRCLSAPPRGYINCWFGTEVGLTHLGAPKLRIIVRLTSLLLSNRQVTPVREPAIFCQR